MCDEYELDNPVCDFDRGSKERERARFTFNLICKADQGNMYQDENDDGEVMVSLIKKDFLHQCEDTFLLRFRWTGTAHPPCTCHCRSHS